MSERKGTLYVVPTPIGNLADMVPRAVQVLQSVSLIAAEDTRHSAPLMAHFDIRAPMTPCHDHNEAQVVEKLLQRLAEGDDIALISDAGTPLISDPGFRLVDAAQAAGYRVCPIPGANAAIAALSAAGLPSDRFVFEGFLSAKASARGKQLDALATETRTMVFYEAPHRLLESLQAMAQTFGDDRTAVLAREISKTYETIKRLPVGELATWVKSDNNQQRGESVILMAGATSQADTESDGERVLDILLEELPLKQAAALAAKISGAKRNTLYKVALERRQSD